MIAGHTVTRAGVDDEDEALVEQRRGRARCVRRALAIGASSCFLGLGLPLGLGLAGSGGAARPTARQVSPGVLPSLPVGIAAGADGNMWFTELVGAAIGRITPAGEIREFPTGTEGEPGPAGIAAGPDGALWFLEISRNRIGRITTAGTITRFSTELRPLALGTGDPQLLARIAAGPDGNMWFTEPGENRIGRITPAGAISEFFVGLTPESGVSGIAAGPDGNMWFTETSGNRIGRITPAGVITEFSDGLSPNSGLSGIAAGPDGNMWFTETSGNRIGRITPAGVITEFSSGLSGRASPSAITAGADGAMWFTEDAGQVGRITLTGAITQLPTGDAPEPGGGAVTAIASGADGALWLTEGGFDDSGRIKRITPARIVTAYPPPVKIVSVRARGATVTVRVACPSARCGGTAYLFLAPAQEGSGLNGTPVVGTRRFSVAPRRSSDVVVAFSARGRRLIRAVGYGSIMVKVRAVPSSDFGAAAEDEFTQIWAPHSVPATVLGVVDGDTIRVRAFGRHVTVRLAEIEAPKLPPRTILDRCFGAAAAERTRRLLPAGEQVTLVAFPNQSARDDLGHLPAFVFKRGRRGQTGSVNFVLVATGYARASVSGPLVDRAYSTAGQRAQESRKGLWGPPCGLIAP